jgi:hypothetical protein
MQVLKQQHDRGFSRQRFERLRHLAQHPLLCEALRLV